MSGSINDGVVPLAVKIEPEQMWPSWLSSAPYAIDPHVHIVGHEAGPHILRILHDLRSLKAL